MSEEEDKSTLNNVENVTVNISPNNEGDGDNQTDNSLLVNGNESSPPCQFDIGLGTHVDNGRHNNDLNVNDSGEATACSTKREDNPLSFRHFLCNNGSNQTSKPKVEVVPSVSQSTRPVTETSTLPDFVQDHLTTDQPYDNGDFDSQSNSIDLTRGINRPLMFGSRNNRTPQQCVVMPQDLVYTNTTTPPRATTTTTTTSLPEFTSDGRPIVRLYRFTGSSTRINSDSNARSTNPNYTRHIQAVEARVARLEATEHDLTRIVLNLNNILEQALIRAQRAENEVRTLRILLRARNQGFNPESLATISPISIPEQIRYGIRNAEILLDLLRDNYQNLNNLAARLEQQENIQTSSTQSSVNPNNTADDDDDDDDVTSMCHS